MATTVENDNEVVPISALRALRTGIVLASVAALCDRAWVCTLAGGDPSLLAPALGCVGADGVVNELWTRDGAVVELVRGARSRGATSLDLSGAAVTDAVPSVDVTDAVVEVPIADVSVVTGVTCGGAAAPSTAVEAELTTVVTAEVGVAPPTAGSAGACDVETVGVGTATDEIAGVDTAGGFGATGTAGADTVGGFATVGATTVGGFGAVGELTWTGGVGAAEGATTGVDVTGATAAWAAVGCGAAGVGVAGAAGADTVGGGTDAVGVATGAVTAA